MKVEVVNLKRYFAGQTRAVDDLSFSFDHGQVFGFVGPNGAGKTTTMRIMATLDEPTEGDVLIDGMSIVDNPLEARKRIGFVPDTLPDHRDITIHEYLDFFARSHDLRGEKRGRVVTEMEDFTGLTGIREKLLNHLSKGMKQRVSLARSLIHDPDLLIMDEPAAGLDPKARIELRELIRALAEQGKSIFISSHILDELAEICDGVVIIDNGKLVQAGKLDQVLVQEGTLRTLWIRPLENLKELYRTLLETPSVSGVAQMETEIRVSLPASDQLTWQLLQSLVTAGFQIVEYRHHRADLEEVFMQMTRGIES